MVRYWVIAPIHYDDVQIFDQYWQYDLDKGVISIGWGMGDISNISYEEFQTRFQNEFPEEWRNRHQVWNFWSSIQEGDYVIARAGRKRVAGVGVVSGPAFYSLQMAQEQNKGVNDHPNENFLPVRWEGKDKEFRRQVFGMQTVTEMTAARFEELFNNDGNSDPSTTNSTGAGLITPTDSPTTEFVLEKYLEEFIESNFERVFGRELSLNRGPGDELGRQYHTDVGIIDILAWKSSSNCYVVIELKRGKSSDEAVGQTLRYMGWVREFLCKEGESVTGLIISREGDERLDYALSMVPDIEVQFYQVDFRLLDRPSRQL